MKKYLKMILLISLAFCASNIYAQKRNYRKPTVTSTPKSKVVYVQKTPKVIALRNLPATTIVVKHKGSSYHYYQGRYYRHINGRYIVVAPPSGMRINTIPAGYSRITVKGKPYLYLSGTYYIQKGNNYEVVKPPFGIHVHELPPEVEIINVDGKYYYEYDNTTYKLVKSVNGVHYEVTGYIEYAN